MPKATVAIEDRRFYDHGGIDPQGIARARLARTSRPARSSQGGSTITQQLVRNLYISNERTVQRKLKEACLAIKLNDAWSKQRILETYLNQVYYGNLAYGDRGGLADVLLEARRARSPCRRRRCSPG